MMIQLLRRPLHSVLSICKGCTRFLRSTQSVTRQISSVPGTHRVYVSVCNNIYYNLSLEEWIYDNISIPHDTGLLLLWRNKPCIVIGRHQNPWIECNVEAARQRQVHVARRKSGGGTVYHDMGNLNLTFVTSRKKYDRKRNLELIAAALRDTWRLNVKLTERDDIVLDDKYKISGTAAKLGGEIAYHHCTLLFDVNTEALDTLLQSRSRGLQSRATESVSSEVKNLCDVDPTISYEGLVNAISQQYLASYNTQGAAEKIIPTNERSYPGVHSLADQHQSWLWLYGKTPKFSISKGFRKLNNNKLMNLHIKLTVDKGLVTEASFSGDLDQRLLERVGGTVTGTKIWPCGAEERNALIELAATTEEQDSLTWLSQCLENVL